MRCNLSRLRRIVTFLRVRSACRSTVLSPDCDFLASPTIAEDTMDHYHAQSSTVNNVTEVSDRLGSSRESHGCCGNKSSSTKSSGVRMAHALKKAATEPTGVSRSIGNALSGASAGAFVGGLRGRSRCHCGRNYWCRRKCCCRVAHTCAKQQSFDTA